MDAIEASPPRSSKSRRTLDESRWRLALWHVRPVHGAKRFGDVGILLIRVVDDHRDQKRLAVRHVMGAIDGESPLAPEVPFQAPLGVS